MTAAKESEQKVAPTDGTDRSLLPTGFQYRLKFNQTSATISSVGATIRSFTVNGQSYLDETPSGEMVSRARGQMLLPWANRIADGRYTFRGSLHQLPINELELNNSIHGLVRWQQFYAVSQSEDTLSLRHLLPPSPGWPFLLETTISFQVFDALLLITVTCENRGVQPAPLVFGSHPYLKLPETPIGDCLLFIPARKVWIVDDRKNPSEMISVNDTERTPSDLDFSTPRTLGSEYLDYAFTDLVHSQLATALMLPEGLKAPNFNHSYITDGSTKVGVFFDHHFKAVQAYFDPSSHSNASIAIEPMTGPPNAFNIEDDDHTIDPSEVKEFKWGIFVQ